MANTTISPNMGLTVPTVGVDPGPDWADNLNSSLSVVDGHNHSPGSGVQINPDGMNISSDLPFKGNNATLLRSARFSPQAAPLSATTDIGCLYESGVDLYYNDANGNQIRITQGGNVAGSAGSISGLTAPASASYVSLSSTFVWQSGVNIPANLDAASIVLRNLTANSKGLTLSPPNAMANNYAISLPALPSSTSVVNIDSSGNMGTVSSDFLVKTGTTFPFPGGSIPSGYLVCNNAAVSRTQYPDLFSKIGITYGPGDGSTTFNLPLASTTFNTITPVVPSQIQSYWHMDGASGAGETNVINSPAYDLTDAGTVPSFPGLLPVGNPKARGVFSNSNYLYWPAAGATNTPFDAPLFAVDFFFNLNSNTNCVIMGKSNPAGGSKGWRIYIDPSDNHIKAIVDGGGIPALDGGAASAFNDGHWHHLAFANFATSGANQAVLYIDAILRSSGTGYSAQPSTADLVIGNVNTLNSPFDGFLDDIAWWSSVPSQASFQATVVTRWNNGNGSQYGVSAQVTVPYIIKT